MPAVVAAAAPLTHVVAVGVELLDAVVGRVGDVDVAGAVNCDAVRQIELTVAAAVRAGLARFGRQADLKARDAANLHVAAPHEDKVAAGVELLDAIGEGVGDVDVAGAVHANAEGAVELPLAHAVAAPLVGKRHHARVEREREARAAGRVGRLDDGQRRRRGHAVVDTVGAGR